MKVAILIFVLWGLGIPVLANAKSNSNVDSTGLTKFEKYLEKNIRYPDTARQNNQTGRVITSFFIGKDKTISDIKIIKGFSDNDRCENEVIRCLKSFKDILNIIPGEYQILVNFSLGEGGANNGDVFYPKSNIHDVLVEVNINSYTSIKKRDYIIDRAYIIPQFMEHHGNVKLLISSSYIADRNWKAYDDSLYNRIEEKHDKKDSIIEKIFTYANGRKITDKYQYTDFGQLLGKSTYQGSKLLTSEYYKYDKLSRKIEQNFTTFNKAGIAVYIYNDLGMMISEIVYNIKRDTIKSKKTYQYNELRLRTVETDYGTNGAIVRTITIAYQEHNKLTEDNYDYTYRYKTTNYYEGENKVKDIKFDTDGSVGFIHLYKYDNKSHLIETTLFGSENDLLYRDIFKYDENGNKVEEIANIGTNSPGNRSTFIYSRYDKKGNWRKAKWTDANTHKQYVVTRQLTYYP